MPGKRVKHASLLDAIAVRDRFDRRKLRQWIISLSLLPAVVAAVVVYELDIEVENPVEYFFWISMAFVAFGLTLWNWRCPQCNRFLTPKVGLKRCPLCQMPLNGIEDDWVRQESRKKTDSKRSFAYEAMDKAGQEMKGVLKERDKKTAKACLKRKGLYLTSLEEVDGAQLACPSCGEPSDRIKSFTVFPFVLFLLFYVGLKTEVFTGCASCVRKKLLKTTLVNVLPGNLLFLVLVFPWNATALLLSCMPGHSSNVEVMRRRGLFKE